jgi:hypothetical protein
MIDKKANGSVDLITIPEGCLQRLDDHSDAPFCTSETGCNILENQALSETMERTHPSAEESKGLHLPSFARMPAWL